LQRFYARAFVATCLFTETEIDFLRTLLASLAEARVIDAFAPQNAADLARLGGWSAASRMRSFALALNLRRFASSALGTTCGWGNAGPAPLGAVESEITVEF
jgi:hypothetical protein